MVDALKAAVSEVVSSDEQVRREAAAFVNLAIRQAKGLLLTGTPDVKAQLIRSVVPAMVKAVTVDDSADEHAELRIQFQELAAEMRATVADPTVVVVESEPVVDAPAKPKAKAKPRAT